jgi:tetratricopeptide (TPR) repeat protein
MFVFQFADFCIQTGKPEKARELYVLASAQYPEQPLVWHKQALLLCQLNCFDEAEDSFKRAIELDQEDEKLLTHYADFLLEVRQDRAQYEEYMKLATKIKNLSSLYMRSSSQFWT